jgi:hypothetical protein
MQKGKCFGSVGAKFHIANQNPKSNLFCKTNKVQKLNIRRVGVTTFIALGVT